jgi:hypothetical protein
VQLIDIQSSESARGSCKGLLIEKERKIARKPLNLDNNSEWLL